MVTLCNRANHYIFIPWFLLSFFPLLISAVEDLMSTTCRHNMVNFGPLATEIVSLVWVTRPTFNWFCILAAFLHGI